MPFYKTYFGENKEAFFQHKKPAYPVISTMSTLRDLFREPVKNYLADFFR